MKEINPSAFDKFSVILKFNINSAHLPELVFTASISLSDRLLMAA